MELIQMHKVVRELTQQMGMQHVRMIFPEQIDNMINLAISQTTNEYCSSLGSQSASVNLPTNVKVGQINALRTLYKVFEFNAETALMSIDLDNGHFMLNPDFVLPTARLYYDASIRYSKGRANTSWFPIRVVEDAYLANITSDFLTKPSFKSPVLIFKQGDNNQSFELYTGKMNADKSIAANGYSMDQFRLSYIKHPNRVALGCSNGDGRVECDLPEYLHEMIVQMAAKLWIDSVMFNKSTVREEAVRAAE